MNNSITKEQRAELVEIAKRNSAAVMDRGDLEQRGYDDADFLDISVWGLQAMLEDAFLYGRRSGGGSSRISRAEVEQGIENGIITFIPDPETACGTVFLVDNEWLYLNGTDVTEMSPDEFLLLYSTEEIVDNIMEVLEASWSNESYDSYSHIKEALRNDF